MKTYLSIDIGGSKYIVGLIDQEGNLLSSRKGTWQTLTQETILETVCQESECLLDETGVRPDACGITIPGLADKALGLWVEASFSGIHDFPICQAISNRLGLSCYCDNDAQAYSLSEMIFGSCQAEKDFLYVNISNGIGGSIVSGGRLLYGSHGNAGEFGHCVVVRHGRPCHCGSQGCLEMYAAGPAIARNYREAGGVPAEDGRPADARLIAERARAGEVLSANIYTEVGHRLGNVIAHAVNLLNPAKVVIGGGVSLAFDLFGPALKETVSEQIFRRANPDFNILPTPLGYMAGLYGAAAIAISQSENLFV